MNPGGSKGGDGDMSTGGTTEPGDGEMPLGGSSFGGVAMGGLPASGGMPMSTGGQPAGPERGDVTIHVFGTGAMPMSGYPVQYNGPDGAVVAVANTNLEGLVTFEDVPDGGTVTAAYRMVETDIRLTTLGGIRIGTTTQLGSNTEEAGALALSLSGQPTGTSYITSSSFGFSSVTGTVNQNTVREIQDARRDENGTIHVLNEVFDSGTLIAMGYAPDIAAVGAAPDANFNASIDSWDTTWGTATLRFALNAPGDPLVEFSVFGTRGGVKIGGTSTDNDTWTSSAPGTAPEFSVSRAVDQAMHTGTFHFARWGEDFSSRYTTIAVHRPSVPGDGAEQVTAISSNDAYDPVFFGSSVQFDEHTLTLTSVAPDPTKCFGVAFDAVELRLDGTGTVGMATTEISWKLLLPYGLSVTPPALDGAFAAQVWPADITLTDNRGHIVSYATHNFADLVERPAGRRSASAIVDTYCQIGWPFVEET